MSVQDSVTSVSNSLKVRLIILVFLQYAVWGTYLISIGRYLALAGLGSQIKWFFALNGLVSLFMPALMGIVSDRFIEAQRTLSVSPYHTTPIRQAVYPLRIKHTVLHAYGCTDQLGFIQRDCRRGC